MSDAAFIARHHSLVYGLLFCASLILQTKQVVAFDSIDGESNAISKNSSVVVVKDDRNWSRAGSSDKALVRKLIDWVIENSSFTRTSNDAPDLKYVALDRLVNMASRQEISNSRKRKGTHKILGLYNYREKTVYISDSLDLQTEKGKGVLLHELVHFLQYENGYDREVSCMNKLETLAYRLETKYLKEIEQDYSPQAANVIALGICTS